jgi:hypothetical protein
MYVSLSLSFSLAFSRFVLYRYSQSAVVVILMTPSPRCRSGSATIKRHTKPTSPGVFQGVGGKGFSQDVSIDSLFRARLHAYATHHLPPYTSTSNHHTHTLQFLLFRSHVRPSRHLTLTIPSSNQHHPHRQPTQLKYGTTLSSRFVPF